MLVRYDVSSIDQRRSYSNLEPPSKGGTMRVLVACEESQRVANEFRKLGHEAYSCDLIESSGGHDEIHIKTDALQLLKMKWDLVIAHPPCTYLACSGNRWFNEEKYGEKARERKRLREEAAQFFMCFIECDSPHIAVENPIGYMSTVYRKPDQIIQPYEFGDTERKATCLWLKGLRPLKATNVVDQSLVMLGNGKTHSKWEIESLNMRAKERAKFRSKTFPGIAKAMAIQWCEQIGTEGIKSYEYYE